MLLDPKTVAVFLDASPSGKKRAAHAAVLAHRWGAHLIGVHVVFAGVTWPPSMDYVRGDEAIEQVVAYRDQLDAEAEAPGGGHSRLQRLEEVLVEHVIG